MKTFLSTVVVATALLLLGCEARVNNQPVAPDQLRFELTYSETQPGGGTRFEIYRDHQTGTQFLVSVYAGDPMMVIMPEEKKPTPAPTRGASPLTSSF